MKRFLCVALLVVSSAALAFGQPYDPVILFEVEGDTLNQQLGHHTLVPVGDVDGDGYDDILANAFTNGHVWPASREWRIYYGSADGTERYISFARLDSIPRAHVVEYDGFFDDMDGDGNLDIFAAFIRDNSSGYSFMRVLYHGGPDFDTIPDWASPWQAEVYGNGHIVGDYDGDGHADYVTVEFNAGRFRFHRGGAQPDSLPSWSFGRSAYDYGVRNGGFGDVNGDGYDDFLRYSTQAAWPDSEALDLFLGGPQADSLPDLTLRYPYYLGHRWRIVSDLNGDGCDDIFGSMGCQEENYPCIYFGGNPPDFEGDLQLFPGSSSPGYIWQSGVGDINGDGYNELALSGELSGPGQYGEVAIYWGGGGWTGSRISAFAGYLEGPIFMRATERYRLGISTEMEYRTGSIQSVGMTREGSSRWSAGTRPCMSRRRRGMALLCPNR